LTANHFREPLHFLLIYMQCHRFRVSAFEKKKHTSKMRKKQRKYQFTNAEDEESMFVGEKRERLLVLPAESTAGLRKKKNRRE
jgi:hypothetical protein